MKRFFAALFLLFIQASSAFAIVAEMQLPQRPEDGDHVVDEAGILSEETEAQINAQLESFLQPSSTAIVVVTVNSLQGLPADEFAFEIGRTWGVGQAEFDNGLVFLMMPKQEGLSGELFIAVGRGLEGVITDAQAALLVQDAIDLYLLDPQTMDYDGTAIFITQYLEKMARGEVFISSEEPAISLPMVLLWTLLNPNFGFFGIFILWALLSWFSKTRAWWLGGVFGAVVGFLSGGGWLGTLIVGLIGLLLDFIVSTFLFGKIVFDSGTSSSRSSSGTTSSSGGYSSFGGGSFGGGGAGRKF